MQDRPSEAWEDSRSRRGRATGHRADGGYAGCPGPKASSIRRIKPMVDQALAQLSPTFDRMYELRPLGVCQKQAAVVGRRRGPRAAAAVGGALQCGRHVACGVGVGEELPTQGWRPAAGDCGRNPELDFHGERRSNETHRSTTDPEARLVNNGKGKEARLFFGAHVLMDNREILVVDEQVAPAGGGVSRGIALSRKPPTTPGYSAATTHAPSTTHP